jgi:hypothetical protein
MTSEIQLKWKLGFAPWRIKHALKLEKLNTLLADKKSALLVYLLTRLFQLHSLQSENTSLRRQGPTTHIYQVPISSGSEYTDPPSSSPSAMKRRQSARASRPMSMSIYETGSGLKPYLPKGETPYPEEGIPTLQPFLPPHVSKYPAASLLCHSLSHRHLLVVSSTIFLILFFCSL